MLRLSIPTAFLLSIVCANATTSAQELPVASNLELEATTADEVAERDEIRFLAESAFANRDYKSLEEQVTRYRNSWQLTSSGTSKLEWFYRSINGIAQRYSREDRASWNSIYEIIDEWGQEYPNSDSPHLVFASTKLVQAAKIRGEAFAHLVPNEDMSVFLRMTVEATEYLVARREISTRNPRWYQLMGWAYRSIEPDETRFRQLMSEGIERFPEYDSLYFVSLIYYEPKWHGSVRKLHEFASDAVEKTENKRGSELYARIFWAAGRSPDGKYYYLRPEVDWQKFRQGIDDVLKRYPTQWNINHLAFFSCLKGDHVKASELLELIRDPVLTSAWHRDENFYRCKRIVEQRRK